MEIRRGGFSSTRAKHDNRHTPFGDEQVAIGGHLTQHIAHASLVHILEHAKRRHLFRIEPCQVLRFGAA